MQNFFEARLKTWDELHNAVLCNLLFSLKDNIPRMPIYYPTITLTAANARFCLCTTTTRFLYSALRVWELSLCAPGSLTTATVSV